MACTVFFMSESDFMYVEIVIAVQTSNFFLSRSLRLLQPWITLVTLTWNFKPVTIIQYSHYQGEVHDVLQCQQN
jgi:hypothetical protein